MKKHVVFYVLIATTIGNPRFTFADDLKPNTGATLTGAKDNDCVKKVLDSAKLIPNIENGQISGVAISEMTSDSLWQKRGFLNGDIIVAMGGSKANDPFVGNLIATAICKKERGPFIVLRKGKTIKVP
jgi:type II secretory pathway component PulC